jgi:hypothetical protein
MVKTYDIASHQLACKLLGDDPRWLKLERQTQNHALDELAKTIQTALEDWLSNFAEYDTWGKCHDCKKWDSLREYEKDNLAGTDVLHVEICRTCYEERTE